jgi:hypothetical protein
MSYLIYQGKRVQSTHKYLITAPTGPINRLTGFVNGPSLYFFDTFTTSGIDINSAIEAPGSYGKCRSNAYPIIGGFSPYGTITAQYYLTVNSGTAPGIEWFRDGASQGTTFPGYAGPGEYQAANIVFNSGNWAWGFVSADTGGVNFIATNCRMYTTNA